MGVNSDKRSPSHTDFDLSAARRSEEGSSQADGVKRDAVFGEINAESGPDYRSVSGALLVS